MSHHNGIFPIILAAITGLSTSAAACSCKSLGGTPSEIIANLDVVFYGVAESARLIPDSELKEPDGGWLGNGVATFRSYRSVKGIEDGQTIEVTFWASGTTCDYPVAVGRSEFVFLKVHDGEYFYGDCVRPLYLEKQFQEYLAIFEEEYGVSFPEFNR